MSSARGRAECGRSIRLARVLLLLLAMTPTAPVQAAENEAPVIRHDPPACAAPALRVRLCAYVVDETGIAQVRLAFRARGTPAYYWTPMPFDGALYCAWLPAPLPETATVEYYVEAVDDQFEPSRTIDHALSVESGCPAQAPGSAPPALVTTSALKQPAVPPGFDPATFTVRPAR